MIAHCCLQNMPSGREQDFLMACSLFTDRGEPGETGTVFLDFSRLARPETALLQLESQLVPRLGSRFLSALAENKLTAKAATMAQSAGLSPKRCSPLVVSAGTAAKFLAPLPLNYLWPADPALLRRLHLLGLANIGQVAAIEKEELYRTFGAAGLNLAAWSRGYDQSRVKRLLPSYVTYQFSWDSEQLLPVLEQQLQTAANYFAAEQRRQQQWGQRLELILMSAAKPELKAKRLFQTPCLAGADLLLALKSILPSSKLPSGTFRFRLGPLVNFATRQLSLFDNKRPAGDKGQVLLAIRRLQERYPGCIQLGACGQISRREQILAFFDPLRSGAPIKKAGTDYAFS
ncbi:MAG TPA: hypothetical protein VJ036_05465 [bacterium]|nr:hypothetical protein [bacterium]